MQRRTEQGLTLVELIVVLAIVAVITALAVPGVARLGAFSDDEVPRTAREIFQMLRAARTYASTYNVKTAVVYSLDSWAPPSTNSTVDPPLPDNLPLTGDEAVLDSITGVPTRYIRAAAVMYALPGSAERFAVELSEVIPSDVRDAFVPLPGDEGNWKVFDENVAVLVNDPDDFTPRYQSQLSRYSIDADSINGFPSLGMSAGMPVILDFDALDEISNDFNFAPLLDRLQQFDRFPAHVFTSDGRLEVTGNGLGGTATRVERYTFLVGPRPDQPLEVRLITDNLEDPRFQDINGNQLYFVDNTGAPNFRGVPIEIFRSTGRVKIAS